MKQKIQRFLDHENLTQMAWETRAITDPPVRNELAWAKSPLRNGAIAERFQHLLFNKLTPLALEMRLQGQPPPTLPELPANESVLLGNVLGTQQPARIAFETLNRPTIIVGKTGAGKSSLIAHFIRSLCESSTVTVEYNCSKNEGRRLLNILPDEVLLFRPDEEPISPLHRFGPVETFCWSWANEFGKAMTSHPTTWPEFAEILVQMFRGLKAGDPEPSLTDVQAVLLKLAERGRPKLYTVAHQVAEFASVIGKTARIRRAPPSEGLSRIVVHENLGVPPKILQFLAALRFLRMQMTAASEGRTTQGLRHLYVEDEGQQALSREFSQLTGSGYISPGKRFFTQCRSTRTGLLIGLQSFRGIDECVKANGATFIIFACPDPDDAREAAELLGLPPQAAPDIQTLPPRIVWIRSEGFGPVKVRVPELELGDYQSDADVSRILSPKLVSLNAQIEYAPESPKNTKTLDYLEILGERTKETTVDPTINVDEIRHQFYAEHRAFLGEIDGNPGAAVTQHYQNLKLSAGRGNRVKNQLLEMGLIRIERQSSQTGRPVERIVLTDLGKELLHDTTN
jgi:hypothetical protein